MAIVFSLAAPILLAAGGAAIDYAKLLSSRRDLQSLADHAAISGAQATRLGNATQSTVSQTVVNVVSAGSRGAVIASTTTIASGMTAVTVKLDKDEATTFSRVLGTAVSRVSATATAKISGGAPLCVASLATTDPRVSAMPRPSGDPMGSLALAALAIDVALLPNPGIMLLRGAKVTAPNCLTSANLPRSFALTVTDTSKLTARQIISAGGFNGAVGTNYSVTPSTDSPAFPDPLASTPTPPVGSCSFTNLTVNGGAPALAPGVYCGGLRITGAANVTLLPGVYVIKDGTFVVDSGSTVTGTGVGFYLTATPPVTASNAPTFYFGTNTHISLSAPATGAMAGMLFFEDRTLPLGGLNAILSTDARTLLGTIYLPRGFLGVASSGPVADRSAYTIIVANALLIYGGPELVLNTNYSATNVPAPAGVGPNTGPITLSQ